MAVLMRSDWPHHELWMLVSSDIERHWRVNACAKEPWTADWLRRLGPGDTLLNVGANVGSYCLPAAAQGAQVIAVEPNILNLARLCENVLANGLGEWVTPVHAAVSMPNYVTVCYGDLRRGSASNPISRPEMGRGPHSLPAPGMSLVEILALHEGCVGAPTHILIDVDGSEVEVLRLVGPSAPDVRSVLLEMVPENEDACSKILKAANLVQVARHTERNGQPMGVVYAEWDRPA